MHTQASWLDEETAARFASPECTETRTWQQIAADMQGNPSLFTSGGLGHRYLPHFRVWACWKQHACLTELQYHYGEEMCYVYHEGEKKWYPWDLGSALKVCAAK
jgi:hypothetical protein